MKCEEEEEGEEEEEEEEGEEEEEEEEGEEEEETRKIISLGLLLNTESPLTLILVDQTFKHWSQGLTA